MRRLPRRSACGDLPGGTAFAADEAVEDGNEVLPVRSSLTCWAERVEEMGGASDRARTPSHPRDHRWHGRGRGPIKRERHRAGVRFRPQPADEGGDLLLEQLFDYEARGLRRLHLPAHGGGARIAGSGRLKVAYRIDLTEVSGLDDWAAPRGILHDAQARAAQAYGLDEAWFLTGGSSQGLTTALLAVLDPFDTLLVHRSVHRSVLHGLLMTGAAPFFVADVWDKTFGLAYPDVQALACEVRRLRPRAVLVTYPTYQGLAPSLEDLTLACKQTGTILIVDSAHGAHFGRGQLPPMASVFSPDLVVYGMHKSGGALTPASLLGRIGNRVDPVRLDAARRLVGTSSPSYPVMASIDLAVWNLMRSGDLLTERSAKVLRPLRGHAVFVPPAGVPQDPTRRVISARLGSVPTGDVLRSMGVVPEYVSPVHALLYAPLGSRPLPRTMASTVSVAGPPEGTHQAPHFEEARMTPREAFFRKPAWVPLDRARGRTAWGLVALSPPGVPLLWPGEPVTEWAIDEARRSLEGAGSVLGVGDGGEVAVIDE